MRRISLLILIFLTPLSVFSQEPLYTLDSFSANARSIPASGNTIIEPPYGDTLSRVDEPPELNPGEILLRRRFGPDEYGLYLGKRKKESYSSLSAFIPPQGLTTRNFIYRKLYMQETDNPNMDMTNVYFDNDYIYVENAAKIIYFEGDWKEISMIDQGSTALTITSYPLNATVIIDDVERGETPLTLKNVLTSFVIVKVIKDGYYQREAFLNLTSVNYLEKNFALQKMIQSTVGAYVNPESYTSEDAESLDELDKQVEKLKKQIDIQKEKNDDALAQFEKEFPSFPLQGEFEKTADFLQRKELYNQKKKSGKMAVMLEGEPKVHKLEGDLHKLTKYRAEIENRLYFRYLPANALNLDRYEPDLEYFPVDIRINEGGHDFSFSGTMQVPLSMAPEFKQNLVEGRLKLTYRNRIFKEALEEGKIKILYEYTKLSILYKGGEYTLDGKCTFPGSTEEREVIAGVPEDTTKIEGEKQ